MHGFVGPNFGWFWNRIIILSFIAACGAVFFGAGWVGLKALKFLIGLV